MAQVWTYEDYCKLPEDGNRYEVIDGVLHVSPAPRLRHQGFSMALTASLFELQRAGHGWVFAAPTDVIMPGATPVEPDVIFVGVEQREILKERFIEGVPKLVVEVLSPSNPAYDRVTKLNLYARCGVPHYWIGDPGGRTLELLRLEGDGYRYLAALGPGDRFEHPDFHGLVLDIDDLLVTLTPS